MIASCSRVFSWTTHRWRERLWRLQGDQALRVEVALLVGSEAPRDDVLAAEVSGVEAGAAVRSATRITCVQSRGTTSMAEVAAVAESVVEPRPLEIAKNRATTDTELAVSAGEARSFLAPVTKSAEARSLGIAMHSAFTVSELAVFSGPRGPERKTRPVPPLSYKVWLPECARRCGRHNSRDVCW